jgi:hypothetical protein
MPRRKPKRNTTYHQRYNALSASEVYTISKIQRLWTLCSMQLKVAEHMFMLCIMLELDDDEDYMMIMLMHVHHCFHIVEFLSSLNNLLMEISSDQVIPCLVPANRNHTFDLLHPGWCYEKTRFRVAQLWELYHLLEFPVMFVLSDKRHYASSEETFILTLTKVATGASNVELADCFGFSGDGMVSLVYR